MTVIFPHTTDMTFKRRHCYSRCVLVKSATVRCSEDGRWFGSTNLKIITLYTRRR